MKRNGLFKSLSYIIPSLIGGVITLSIFNPEFKENLKHNLDKINMTSIESTIDKAEDYAADKIEDLKEFSSDKLEKLPSSFKKDEEKEVIETDSTYNVFPIPETVVEEPVIEEETIEVIEEPVEEVIYDEYTDSYLLDNGYEFKDINANEYNEQNSDYVGYLDIPGTTMDYPVYQKVNDDTNDYYLHRDRKENYYYPGEIYIHTNNDLSLGDDSSTVQSSTIDIFGHNMNDLRPDKKFCDLKNFKKQSYLDSHPYGVYYSEDGSVYALEIVAGYKLSNGTTDKDFMIYNLDNIENFNNYRDFINENAMVKSDVELEYGDKIVNLIACTHKDKGDKDPKYVVVCKAVKQYTNENQITNSEEKVKRLTK